MPQAARDRTPGTGFVLQVWDPHSVIPEQADVLLVTAVWSEVEKTPGTFDWDILRIKSALDAAKSCDRKVGLRLVTSFSGFPTSIPQWLIDRGVRLLPPDPAWAAEAIGRDELFEPEWWNPVYLEAYRQLVAAYGARFDGDPLIEWIDMRFYGFWGEGHRWGSQAQWPAEVNKRELLKSFIDMHFDAFKKTPLVINLGSDKDEPYPEGTAIDHALERHAWIRRDGFGSYLSPAESALLKSYQNRVPVIGEAGRSNEEYLNGRVPGYSIDALFDEMFDHGTSYISMGWSEADWNKLVEARPDLVEKLTKKMGERN